MSWVYFEKQTIVNCLKTGSYFQIILFNDALNTLIQQRIPRIKANKSAFLISLIGHWNSLLLKWVRFLSLRWRQDDQMPNQNCLSVWNPTLIRKYIQVECKSHKNDFKVPHISAYTILLLLGVCCQTER